MKIKNIENTSDVEIELKHKSGVKTILPPKQILQNSDITNLSEVRGQVKVTYDLTEVNENQGKTRLDD